MAVIPGVGRLEDNQDKPIVAALIAFLSDIYRRSLKAVIDWHIADFGTGYGEFRILFHDNTGVRGLMVEGVQGWQVRQFQATITITGNTPTCNTISIKRTFWQQREGIDGTFGS